MNNVEINNKTRTKINKKLIENIVIIFLKKYHKTKKDISIAFIGDRKMKELNNSYRKINKTTDVLSFEGDDDLFGEIIISLSKIKKQAKSGKKSFKEELIFILVHGLFHLLGYDDETEKNRLKMIKLGKTFIEKELNKV